MNWKKIIKDMLGSGMTQADIATGSGIAQSTVSALLNGLISDPGWSKGNALLRLHAERCQQPQKEVA